jgi:vacuolar-type H+-ATPase subunit I/STV1
MSIHHRQLFPDDPDPLLKWKAEAEARELELAAERSREEHAQQRTGSVVLLRAEVQTLRSELQQLRDRRQDDLKNLADVTSSVADVIERLPDWIETAAKKSHNELRALIAERFAELIGRIRALDG